MSFSAGGAKGGRKVPDVGGAVGFAALDAAASGVDVPSGAEGEKSAANDSGELSVSQFIEQLRAAISAGFPKRVTIVGELSNVSTPASGHIDFDLKDSAATIPCAMWKPRAAKLKFRPANGLEVVVEATVDVYPAQGKVQLYVERITPRGEGALELAFRQLRESLAAEGLFDPARKKLIPNFPRAIGVVTSATGAAIRDIERTLSRRWPLARVYLFPAMVQGDGAALRIAGAISALDRAAERLGIDTLIVGRGGGSLEDLWCFN